MKLNKMLYTVLLCSTALWASRNMENLDRGLVAVKVGSGVYVGWRVLGTDAASTGFNVYRDGVKVNSAVVTGATNLVDASGTISSTYTVKPVVGGVEQAVGGTASVWAAQGKAIPLDKPAGGTTPDNVAYTYTPNDMATGDLDGDGQWELVVKWDPSNSKDNSQSGYTGNVFIDAYELDGNQLWRIDLGVNIRAGAHYTQMLVGDYDSDGKAEVALKTAPGTKDGTGTYLSLGSAAGAAHTTDYRNSKGYILSGAEFLTVFNGLTGKEMATINYVPARGTVSSWGDSYGNRVDRFLATNAYLDGIKPSMVFQRGYYTRMAVAAFDWNGTTLSQRWYYNSATSGSGCYGQGHHNLSSADVDSDGKDEIIEGSCAINDDGTFMYRTGLGHGDAIHVGDLMPSRAGLEVFTVHEETSASYGYEMHDAATGAHIWGVKTGTDNGRGLAADVDSNYAGYEAWSFGSSNVFTSQGVATSNGRPSINFRIYWDGDLQDEILDGTKLDDWTGSGTNRLMSFYNYPTTSNGAVANNTTKANPGLVADLLGDWREEAIYPMSSGDSLVIFTTTTPTTHRLYTLMHDPVYRNAISWQNTAYNQPPHLGFFLGNGAGNAPIPDIKLVGANSVKVNSAPVITSASTISVAENTASKFVLKMAATDVDGDALTYTITGGDDQAQFILGATSANLYFTRVPNYEFKRDADGNNAYKVRVQVSDGALTVTQNLVVTVTDVNEAPVFDSENAIGVAEKATTITTLSATDPEGAAISYSISGGADAARFTINASTGALQFAITTDYETPVDAGADNVYNVTVVASDGFLTTPLDVAVTIANSTEGVTFGSANVVAVAENIPVVTTLLAVDAEGGALTYSITGGDDMALFSLDAASGVLQFVAAPDYEKALDADGNNAYKVRVQAANGAGLGAVQSLVVTVTDVNEVPNAIALTALSIDENMPSGSLVGLVSAVDSDAMATLVFSLVSSANGAFRLEGASLLTTASFDYESGASYDIMLRATDQDGLAFDQVFVIAINDVEEQTSNTSVLEMDKVEFQAASYRVFDMHGRMRFNNYQRSQQLPQGLWVVRAYNGQGKVLQSWIERGKY